MKTVLFSIAFLSMLNAGLSQAIPPDSLYLGQIPPDNIRKIFNLTADPEYFAAEKIAISPDGKEIYFEETNASWTSFRFKYYKYDNNQWNEPVNLFNNYYCLSLSPEGNNLYFENNNYNDCWISGRQGANWNPPSRFLNNFKVHSLNVTGNGNYYLSSNPEGGLGQRDICKLMMGNSDTSLVGLGLPVNSGANEGDFFISVDESFMIFMSNRSGGYGSTDLYISFNKNDDTWTNPKNMGPWVNTSTDDFGPYVTGDNEYLFYESGYSGPSSIYWIRIDGLMDSLRHTNFIPYVKNLIPDQTAIKGELFTFTIPDTTFIDDDGNNTLTYQVKLTDGSPLPEWLAFDTLAGTFTGTPAIIETLNIRVTATDTAGATVSTNFKIMINNPVSIEPVNGQLEGVLIFPNPTNGLINISSSSLPGITAMVEIRDQKGKAILKNTFEKEIVINLADRPKGMYFINLTVDHQTFMRKVCVE